MGLQLPASAQDTQGPPPDATRGSNYDPPRAPRPKPADVAPAPEPGPLFALQELDWKDKFTWVKFALLVGSVLLALRAFRQMKVDEADHDDE